MTPHQIYVAPHQIYVAIYNVYNYAIFQISSQIFWLKLNCISRKPFRKCYTVLRTVANEHDSHINYQQHNGSSYHLCRNGRKSEAAARGFSRSTRAIRHGQLYIITCTQCISSKYNRVSERVAAVKKCKCDFSRAFNTIDKQNGSTERV